MDEERQDTRRQLPGRRRLPLLVGNRRLLCAAGSHGYNVATRGHYRSQRVCADTPPVASLILPATRADRSPDRRDADGARRHVIVLPLSEVPGFPVIIVPQCLGHFSTCRMPQARTSPAADMDGSRFRHRVNPEPGSAHPTVTLQNPMRRSALPWIILATVAVSAALAWFTLTRGGSATTRPAIEHHALASFA
jgi:hypothetical protein